MTRVKEARLAAGLSQEELARRAGISRAAIAQYESARPRMPAGDILVRLSEVLGVSEGYLIGRTDSPKREDRLPQDWVQAVEEAMAQGYTSEEVKRVLRAFRRALRSGGEEDKS